MCALENLLEDYEALFCLLTRNFLLLIFSSKTIGRGETIFLLKIFVKINFTCTLNSVKWNIHIEANSIALSVLVTWS